MAFDTPKRMRSRNTLHGPVETDNALVVVHNTFDYLDAKVQQLFQSAKYSNGKNAVGANPIRIQSETYKHPPAKATPNMALLSVNTSLGQVPNRDTYKWNAVFR